MSQLFQFPFTRAIGPGSAPVFLPLSTLTFYQTGTTILASIYNATGGTQPNPATADGFGRFPAIYLNDATIYRVVLKDRDGALVPGCDFDPINESDNALQTFISGFSPDLASFLSGAVPLPIESGGTDAENAAAARINLGAAKSGSNSDITALTGLTTLITVAQGGTGVGTLAALSAGLGFVAAGAAAKGHADFPFGAFGVIRLNWASTTVSGNSTTTDTLHANYTTGFGAVGPGFNDTSISDSNNCNVWLATNSTVGITNGLGTTRALFWLALGLV